MQPKQEKFLNHIKSLGRLMTDDEALEYYVENHMRVDVSCKFNYYAHYYDRSDGIKKDRSTYYEDYSLNELRLKAIDWHRRMIGQLVMRGFIKTEIWNPDICR
jgi:hypothetical protein